MPQPMIYPGMQWMIVRGHHAGTLKFPENSVWTVKGRFDAHSWALTGVSADGQKLPDARWFDGCQLFNDPSMAIQLKPHLPVGSIIEDPKLLQPGMIVRWSHGPLDESATPDWNYILVQRIGNGWIWKSVASGAINGTAEKPVACDYNFPKYKMKIVGYVADVTGELAPKEVPSAQPKVAPKCALTCTPTTPCNTKGVCPQGREPNKEQQKADDELFHESQKLDVREARSWRQTQEWSPSPTGYGGLVGRFRY